MQPPEYTLDHAAEILGMRTEELLSAAEVGSITFVFIARVNQNAPTFIGEDENAPMFLSEDGFGRKGFRVARMDESGKTIGSYYLTDSRLQIIVCIEDIPKLADGLTLTKMGGFIYKAGAALLDRSHTYVELGRAVGICPPIYGVDPGYKTLFNRMHITLSDLRVPAEEIERITHRPRAAAGAAKQSDQPKPQTAKMSVPIKSRTRIQRNRAAVESARAELLKAKNRDLNPCSPRLTPSHRA